MKRPLLLAAVVALAIGLLALGAGLRDSAPSTRAQGAATATTAPTATPTAAPTTTTATPTCTATTLGVARTANDALAKDCDKLLSLRHALSTAGGLNWDAGLPLASWTGVVLSGTPTRVTGLDLRPYEVTGALDGIWDLGALVDLRLAVYTTPATLPTPATAATAATAETTLPAASRSLACTDATLGAGVTRATHARLAADCDTLLRIKSTLVGALPAGTSSPLNWAAGTEIGSWTGVKTGGTPKRVSGLNLPGKSLSRKLAGIIPTQLGNLTGLKEELSLDGNQLTGSIPTQLGNLTALTVLEFRDNRLTGSIPTQLGNLTALTWLRFSHNDLTGTIPTQLGGLTSLNTLKIGNNQLTGPIPTQLGNLSSLINLTLNVNHLTGSIPAQLGNLRSLRGLQLSANQLTGSIPTQLGNLPGLGSLLLRYNRLSGDIPPLPGNLRIAYIAGNRFTGCTPATVTRAGLSEETTATLASLGLPPACPATGGD